MEFGRLTDLIDNILGLEESEILYKVYSNDFIQEEIIELNTTDQLYNKGVDSKGVGLGSYASSTIKYKSDTGQRYDHITLNDEGGFYDSWTITPTMDGFWIDANDFKRFDPNSRYNRYFGYTSGQDVYLFDQWGVDVLGLTDESLNVLVPDLIAETIEITLHEILQ